MSIFRNLFDTCMSIFLKTIPERSYSIEFDSISSQYVLRLKNGNEYSNCHRYRHHCETFIQKSLSGNDLVCLMLRPVAQPKYTILFNHGGTVDIGKICNFLYTLARRLECNIFVYDYSGYGQSTGRPTEQVVYDDAETVWSLLIDKYRLQPNQIVIYGQSLGTGPTLHLASKHKQCKGVILHSPFLSMAKLYMPGQSSNRLPDYDVFRNVEMIAQVEAPVLIIHGSNDRVVPISHGKKLFEKCPNPVQPLWVDGGGHDNLYTYESYLTRLKRFINHDLQ